MSGYKAHSYAGLLAALTLVVVIRALGHVEAYQLPELFAAALCGALFPDIDTGSKGRRVGLFIAVIGGLILSISGHPLLAALFVGLLMISALAPHRGPTHTLFFLLCSVGLSLSVIAFYFQKLIFRAIWISFFFSIGFLTHLLLDRKIGLLRRRRRRW